MGLNVATPVDVQGLIHRAQKGDSSAVAQLYQMHAQAIYQYVLYRVPTTEDAEDLTAEVFVKMVEGLPSYQYTGAPFESWLYRIAAARVADSHRRAYRRPQIELTESLTSIDDAPEDYILQEQELDSLRAALAKLNEDYQTVLVLRFIERKSHEEVAEIMTKSVTAVKTIQHRALHRLASLLGSDSKARHYLRGDHD
jgi:RNA polymerase sigma-70 factor (ECF subfamily)